MTNDEGEEEDETVEQVLLVLDVDLDDIRADVEILQASWGMGPAHVAIEAIRRAADAERNA